MSTTKQLKLLRQLADQSEAQPSSASQKKLQEPLPADSLGRRLCELFPYRWKPIVAPIPDDILTKVVWQTITQYPLRPRVLWKLWQDSSQLVGVRFGDTTYYAVLDLDLLSAYHPNQSPTAFAAIRTALESIGIYRTVLLRSSWSGGLHLYIPLAEKVSTFDLAVALKQVLEAHGFAVCPGQLEIFPNVKRYSQEGQFSEYNAHRLPLQPATGSTLLNDDLQPIWGTLEHFFKLWDTAASGQDLAELKTALSTHRKRYRPYPTHHSNRVESWHQDLITEIEGGWTGHGQTNHLLFVIACYGVVFQGLSGDALTQYVEHTALNCPGYKEWCQHQHEIHKRAKAWAVACESYYWPLGSTPKRRRKTDTGDNNIVPFNRQKAEDAQERIRQAVSELQTKEELPAAMTARMKAIATVAKCSFSTLQKYKSLWWEQETVTAHPEPDLAPPIQELPDVEKHPEPKLEEELHTNAPMKGETLGFGLLLPKISSVRKGEGQGRGTSRFPQPEQREPEQRDCVQLPLLTTPTSFSPTTLLEEDLDEVTSRIQQHIRRLGWSPTEGHQFIANSFNGKRRSQLTSDELILLLYRLQNLNGS